MDAITEEDLYKPTSLELLKIRIRSAKIRVIQGELIDGRTFYQAVKGMNLDKSVEKYLKTGNCLISIDAIKGSGDRILHEHIHEVVVKVVPEWRVEFKDKGCFVIEIKTSEDSEWSQHQVLDVFQNKLDDEAKAYRVLDLKTHSRYQYRLVWKTITGTTEVYE